jgi:hypothetical protein
MSSCVSSDRNKVWGGHRSWFLVRPPSRPATWQLNVIREWLDSLEMPGDVAILGSTPEFQDLVAEFDQPRTPPSLAAQPARTGTGCHHRRLDRGTGAQQLPLRSHSQ